MEGVTAIVVTHNSGDAIGVCLDSLRGQARLIVVDNASTDETLQEVQRRPWAELISNHDNRGFAGAVNQAAAVTGDRFLLILNPDAVVTGELAPLTKCCELHGIAAGCLINADGSPQEGFSIRRLPSPSALTFECLGLNRVWPSNPVNRRYRCLDVDLSRGGSVEQPAGAFLMIRRDIFVSLGGFDERFHPVWFEDVDFCRRAIDAGYTIAYTPHAKAVHVGGHSVRGLSQQCRRVYWYASLLRYAGKHYRTKAFRLICFAVIAGSLLRMLTDLMDRRTNSNSSREYGLVMRLAASSLLAGRLVYRPLTGT
jgi:hypothetical protein